MKRRREKKDQTLSLKVTDELKSKLEDMARKEGRSLSNLVQLILVNATGRGRKR